MATVTPLGVVRVCKGVPLSNDYKHTLWFKNDSLFFAYFREKVARTYERYNIIRDEDAISVEATYDEARTWNYMYFQNNGTGGSHIYFAFITRVEYVNEATVKLHYEIDVMMSYYWSYTLNQCFVEREHSATDRYYENLIEEGLEVGEYIDDVTTVSEINEMCVLIMSTVNLKIIGSEANGWFPQMAHGYILNRTYTSCLMYAVDSDSVGALNTVLQALNVAGKTEAILGMWMYPKALVKLDSSESWGESNYVKLVDGVKPLTQTITPASDFGGYTPKNKKLYSYPYNFLYVSNNAGASAVYKHELVNNNEPQTSLNPITFNFAGAISPEASVRMYPSYYRKKGNNFEEGITLGAYPSCSWNSDTYKLWLAQNQNQIAAGIDSAVINATAGTFTAAAGAIAGGMLSPTTIGAIGAGVAGGAGIGMNVVNSFNQVRSIVAQIEDKKIQPPNAHGAYTANINVGAGYQTFTISRRVVTPSRARIIDEYFTRYGYATHRFKVPNTHARKSFTYVKTVDCQITANLSHDIIQKIQSVYNNGVTIWADPSVVGVYTCDNSCL